MASAGRTGMAHSLEMRAPILAPPLVELAQSFPAAIKLRRSRVRPVLTDELGSSLAPGVVGRPKQPFNPPVRGWLHKHIAEHSGVLVGPRSELGHVLAPKWVRTEFEDFRSGKRDNSTLL